MQPSRIVAAFCLVAVAACSRELSLPQPLPQTGFLSGIAVVDVAGTDQTQPVPGALAAVPGTNVHAVSDSNGAFTLGPLPAGRYRLLVTLQGTGGAPTRQRLLEGVQVSSGNATSLVGPVAVHLAAIITGRVLLAGSATGNAGTTVFIPGTNLATITGDNGGYSLRGVPEGTVRVNAFHAGYSPATPANLAALGGQTVAAADLSLPAAPAAPHTGSVRGQIAQLLSPPLPVSVSLYGPGDERPVGRVTAGADGSFALEQVPVGLYDLRAEAAGAAPVDLPGILVSGGASIVLTDALVIQGLGPDNIAFDAGPPPVSDPAVPDAGSSDAGSQCFTDAECAPGEICRAGVCSGCSFDSDCVAGAVCRHNACERVCTSNASCAPGEVCAAGGICGPCVASSDCKDPGLVCLGGSCGHCRGSADCPAGKACLAAGCGTCGVDADCGAGHVCESGVCLAGACHDNAGCPATQVCTGLVCTACSQDAQCSAGRLCLAGQCLAGDCRTKTDCPLAKSCNGNQCGGCSANADCGAGLVCDAATHACTPGNCNLNADCAAGAVCLAHSCQSCPGSASCGAGQVCVAGSCIAGNCARTADCAAGGNPSWVCTQNFCAPCSRNTDCGPAGEVCAAGQCTPGNCLTKSDCTPINAGFLCISNQCGPCTADGQCGQGNICVNGACAAGTCHDDTGCLATQACIGHACTSCAQDGDCLPGRLCLSGACTPANCRLTSDCASGKACIGNSCQACGTSADCGAGFVCDPSSHACVGGSCISSTDCGGGLVCLSHNCSSCSTSAQCAAGQVCAANKCVAGNCAQASDCAALNPKDICKSNHCALCAVNADCGTGQVCASGACKIGNCLLDTDCPSGDVCTGNACSTCTASTQCGAGRICPASGLCTPGNCATTADCTGANAGLICKLGYCAVCSAKSDCAQGQVCAANGTCQTGNCVGNSDCPSGELCNANLCQLCSGTAQCQAGLGTGYVCGSGNLCVQGNCTRNTDCTSPQICSANKCQACSADNQCLASQICSAGACIAGNCHTSADCSGGNVCIANSCQVCGSGGTGLQGGCASNQVCDTGLCTSGNCVKNTDCAAGQICASHTCGQCTANAQCGSGFVCVSGACAAGSCTSDTDCPAAQVCNTGTRACYGTCRTNSDCSAVQTCSQTTHNCIGNCRQTSDCTSTQVCNTATSTCYGNCRATSDCVAAGGGYCDLTKNLCASCTSSAQCGSPATGYICDTPSQKCVSGICSTDVTCPTGSNCNAAHQCTTTAPITARTFPAGTAIGAGTGPLVNANPTLLEGKNGYYFSVSESAATVSGLLDKSTLAVIWKSVDRAVSGSSPNPGVVIAAPGLPGGEIYIAPSGAGDHLAHSAVDGSVLWNFNAFPLNGGIGFANLAAGIANGLPVVYGMNSQLVQVRPDGTHPVVISPGNFFPATGCAPQAGPAVGAANVYILCDKGLEVINQNTMQGQALLLWSTFNSGFTAMGPSTPAVSRNANNTGDLITWAGNQGSGPAPGTYLMQAQVLDASPTAPSISFPPVLLPGGSVQTFGYRSTVLLDAAGNAYLLTGNTLHKVSPSGTLAAQIATPFASGFGNGANTVFALLNDPDPTTGTSVVSLDANGNLIDLLLTGSGSFIVQWTAPFTAGSYANAFPGVLASGYLDAWGGTPNTAWAPQLLQSRTGTSYYLPAPAWPALGGDSGGHNAVTLPGGCATDAACAASQTCVLGQCIGQCRSGADCAAGGNGCSAGACGPCTTDAACGGASNYCFQSHCLSCGANCCHTTADCSASQYCNQAHCAALPTLSVDQSRVLPQTGWYNLSSEGTDGTLYLENGTNANSGPFQVTAYNPATGAPYYTVPMTNSNVAGIIVPLMVVRLPGQPQDTLFWANNTSGGLYSFQHSTSGTPALVTTPLPSVLVAPLALGKVKAKAGKVDLVNGVNVPALFGIGGGRVWAIDAAAAAAGTLVTYWNIPSLCAAEYPSSGGLWVLRDGAVLQACGGNSGSGWLQAWEPNGDPATPGYGKLRWQITSGLKWTNDNLSARSAIGQSGNNDVLYMLFTDPSNSLQVYVLDIPAGTLTAPSGGGLAVSSTTAGSFSNCDTAPAAFADANGNGIIYCNTGAINVVQPNGHGVSYLNVPGLREGGGGLGTDNVLYTATTLLTGIAIDPVNLGINQLWGLHSPNNGSFGNDIVTLLHGGRVAVTSVVNGSTTGQDLLLYSVPAAGPAPSPAWSAWGGDNQRRNSVEAMIAGPAGF